MYKERSVRIPWSINDLLLKHLIREDGQEDLIFCLWTPSIGSKKYSALINEVLPPLEGDRQVHGNVSFNMPYIKRVCQLAMEKGMGVAFIHSHPYPGWQSMSEDDIKAETKLSSTVDSLTDLPLVGLTVGSDGTWSSRIWEYSGQKFERMWCGSVSVVGPRIQTYFADFILPPVGFREMFKRTRTVYGKKNHDNISRLRVGIIGLGSVGSVIAELLARMGIERFTLIDFDKTEEHNLDRMLGASIDDLHHEKVFLIERQIRKASTAKTIEIDSIPKSISTEVGYKDALNCDVLFSCVDKPRARYILNHLAYNHLIPVIDGGIKVSFDNDENFYDANWQVQTVTPEKPCLSCLNTYQDSDVSLEIDGLFDDPKYMEGTKDEKYSNENVLPFSMNLASMEVFQFMSLTTDMLDIDEIGVQRFRLRHNHISNYLDRKCKPDCDFKNSIGLGDKYITVYDKL